MHPVGPAKFCFVKFGVFAYLTWFSLGFGVRVAPGGVGESPDPPGPLNNRINLYFNTIDRKTFAKLQGTMASSLDLARWSGMGPHRLQSTRVLRTVRPLDKLATDRQAVQASGRLQTQWLCTKSGRTWHQDNGGRIPTARESRKRTRPSRVEGRDRPIFCSEGNGPRDVL